MKVVTVKSGHRMHVSPISREDLPTHLQYTSEYDKFYVARNWDAEGNIFFYLGKKDNSDQIVVWYKNCGGLWHSYGKTFKEALNGAQEDGWLCA